MAGRRALLGERAGARLFYTARQGYDPGNSDLAAHAFTGTIRTERIAPAGPNGLVNFRRVAIKVYSSGTFAYTVKVWVDDVRTVLGTGATQTIDITETSGVEGEYTNEIAIEAMGNHIRVELLVNSTAVTAPFLLESITAHGRVIRGTASRAGETS